MRLMKAALMAGCLTWTSIGDAQGQRTDLTLEQFTGSQQASKLVVNSAFLPTANAAEAHAPFAGTITVSETEMTTEPVKLKSDNVLGKNPAMFPAAVLSFVTHNGDLVPSTQDILRYGSTPDGRSFWDIIVQAGKVWSEPGDDGWSRASFPFALMHSIEGETHNGVAMFLYKGDAITDLRFQIVQHRFMSKTTSRPLAKPTRQSVPGMPPMKLK